MISAIVAADKNMAIGVNGGMLCHIPGDLKYFKNVTMGCVMVVGRKTYDGLPVKPLPGRDHIVITRAADNSLTPVQDRVFKTNLQGAMDYLSSHSDENLFVIGGGEIYSELLPLCQRVYLTKIDESFPEADTYFPHLQDEEWTCTSKSEPMCENGITYRFCVYDRK